MPSIADNLADIRKRLIHLEEKYGRERHSVVLLAVSKTQGADKVMAAHAAGQSDFGENYLQEALIKITACQHLPLTWHFIGPIQSNKTRKIAENFAWVHSVENEKIAKRLNDQRPSHLPPLNICIEVNVSHEPSKSGAKLNEVLSLATYCQQLPNLTLRGLMAIPAEKNTLEEQRAEFHKLVSLKAMLDEQHIQLDTLSMGMSGDYEAAIAEGATIVRIGTAIFGRRV